MCLILSSHNLMKDITITQDFTYGLHFGKNKLWNIKYCGYGPQSMELPLYFKLQGIIKKQSCQRLLNTYRQFICSLNY